MSPKTVSLSFPSRVLVFERMDLDLHDYLESESGPGPRQGDSGPGDVTGSIARPGTATLRGVLTVPAG